MKTTQRQRCYRLRLGQAYWCFLPQALRKQIRRGHEHDWFRNYQPVLSVGPEAAVRTSGYWFAIVGAGVCLVFELAGHAYMVFYEVGRLHSKGIRVSVMQHVPSAEAGDRWAKPLVLKYKVPALAWPQSYI